MERTAAGATDDAGSVAATAAPTAAAMAAATVTVHNPSRRLSGAGHSENFAPQVKHDAMREQKKRGGGGGTTCP
jgi:hypothetical protein